MICVRRGAGLCARRSGIQMREETLVDTQERVQVPGTKTWKTGTTGVEREAETWIPGSWFV